MDILYTYIYMDSTAIAAGDSKKKPLQFDIGLYYWMITLRVDVFWSFLRVCSNCSGSLEISLPDSVHVWFNVVGMFWAVLLWSKCTTAPQPSAFVDIALQVHTITTSTH